MSNEFSPTDEERNLAVIIHLCGLSVLITGVLAAIPALIFWLVYKDKSAFVEETAREGFNFQITMTIATVILGLLFCLFFPPFLIPIVILLQIIFSIIGALEAGKSNLYRYPLSYPFLK